MLPTTSRAWHLLARPKGWPKPEDVELREVEIPELAPGRLLVRNLFLSVDPAMRGRMNDAKSYVPPFKLNEPMEGGAVGRVLASTADGFAEGDYVLHWLGWREYTVVDAEGVTKVDPNAAALSAYLGVLGMTGLTAWSGLLDVASFKAGEAVFVSGAAGAVGSQVGQIAKLKGASRVIGSAGSAEKVELLVEEYGFDAAFDYKEDTPVADQLAKAAPDGIDVYFDNVGGEHLEAAIGALHTHGRVAMCGAIAQYNATESTPAPRNLALSIGKRLRLQGFIVIDHYDRRDAFFAEVGGWLKDGKLKYRETVVEGIENTFDAFLGMLRGENTGKMVVALPE
ncbi:NADP-dependent oxidoreductase [Streptomyces sp. SID3343]|uniref:NADP-dependent oxidoreductase n=1 Tax=Streptomyces sp. SID3343 TaxID=2690260 RepID=UPI00136E8B1B|nr:NADP-dependent oxidoreductase [Streptomyces sp. SID3343]MYW05004.1 zinc-binding dehydrogenase [Streptomyces sp. SID3343]